MTDRDYISIGAKLDEMIGLELLDTGLKGTGKAFVKQTGHNTPHHVLKQVTFFERGLDILDFAMNNMGLDTKSKPIVIMSDGAKCSAIVYNGGQTDNEMAMITDLTAYTARFILLCSVESRRPGAGGALIREIIQRVNGRMPILLQAGCEYAGDYFTRRSKTVDKNTRFYESLGFKNVNDVIGNYGNSVAMLYCDDELYEKIRADGLDAGPSMRDNEKTKEG